MAVVRAVSRFRFMRFFVGRKEFAPDERTAERGVHLSRNKLREWIEAPLRVITKLKEMDYSNSQKI